MATDKPRITITLEPEHYAVLQRMAKVQRGSMARIVTDLFREVAPMLERVTEAMETAAKAQEGMKASIRKAAEDAERDMQPLVATMVGQFDHFAQELERLVVSGAESPPVARPGDTAAAVGRRGGAKAGKAGSPRTVITGAMNPNGGGGKGADSMAGVVWWNGLTVAERAAWCRKSGSSVPADAWACFKREGGAV